MGSKMRRKQQVWYVPQPLTPLMEWPDPEMQEEGNKKESSWEVIREWFRATKNSPGASFSSPFDGAIQPKKQDLRLLLGVLGCPLAPIPLVNDPIDRLHIKDIPMVYIYIHVIFLFLLLLLLLNFVVCNVLNCCLTGDFNCKLYHTTISSGHGVSKATKVCKNHVRNRDGEDDLL